MIKIVASIILLCSFSIRLNAQKKDINFIISIDGDIVTSNLSGFKLVAVLRDGVEQTVKSDYYPGNLSVSEVDYNMLLDTNTRTVFIVFDYVERCRNFDKTYNYKIDLKKGWLTNYYYILRIYNTSKRQYRKVYSPLEGQTYTYEYDYPGGSVNRITKRRKQKCN